MKNINNIIKEHVFFQELSEDDIAFIAGCGKNVVFKAQERIAKGGDSAEMLYLIRHGTVALVQEGPGGKSYVFQMLGGNEIVGLACLIPPYRWIVSAVAKETTRAIAIDGACLRDRCEKDPRLGYKLMKHLVQVLIAREEEIHLHLMDIYGKKGA
jgi:CRP/FNR family cyclic AMP-dependent transcriptional regulator